jgi:ribonuclease P protein component
MQSLDVCYCRSYVYAPPSSVNRTSRISWVSQLTAHVTSAASGLTAFGRECPPAGGARHSAVVGRRVANVSPFSCHRSTPAPDKSVFPRARRLTGKAGLAVVLREGKRVRTRSLDVRAVSSPLPHPRAAIVVPRRGRQIVHRNRVKRRLRELVRLHVLGNLKPIDIVVLAREHAYVASFEQLRNELVEAVRELAVALQRR